MNWYEQVQEFSKIANSAQHALNPSKWPLIPESPTQLSDTAATFISQMIEDEIQEFEDAETEYEQADALLDIVYYTLDTAAKHALPLEFETGRVYPNKRPTLISVFEASVIADSLRVIAARIMASDDHQEALRDMCYIAVRHADESGFDLNPLFKLVQDANMAKFPEGVVTLDTDPASKRYGKVEKPAGWQKPDSKIKEALEDQKISFNYEDGQDIDEWYAEQKRKHNGI